MKKVQIVLLSVFLSFFSGCVQVTPECKTCNGTGKGQILGIFDCSSCKGTGKGKPYEELSDTGLGIIIGIIILSVIAYFVISTWREKEIEKRAIEEMNRLNELITCPKCNGSGMVVVEENTFSSGQTKTKKRQCNLCGGKRQCTRGKAENWYKR